MDFDEIRDDDEQRKKLIDAFEKGEIRSVPNLRDLPDEHKDKICKQVSHHCMELMMKTYISVGVDGHCIIGASDGVTDKRYKLTFRVLEKGEHDEHLG